MSENECICDRPIDVDPAYKFICPACHLGKVLEIRVDVLADRIRKLEKDDE